MGQREAWLIEGWMRLAVVDGAKGVAKGGECGGGHDSREFQWGDENIGEVNANGSDAWKVVDWLLTVGKVSRYEL